MIWIMVITNYSIHTCLNSKNWSTLCTFCISWMGFGFIAVCIQILFFSFDCFSLCLGNKELSRQHFRLFLTGIYRNKGIYVSYV